MRETVAVREIQPGRWVVVPSGTLGHCKEEGLADALGRATTANASWIGLDLGEIREMDGGGLSLLVRFAFWCRDQGVRPILLSLPPRARRVFAEQGLEAAMTLQTGGSPGDPSGPSEDREFCPPGEWACGLGRVPRLGPEGNFLPENLAGAAVASPMDGFGELWHKIYRLRVAGIDTTPEAAAGYLHGHLGELWPRGNHLRLVGAEQDLVPGAVGHIQLKLPGGAPLSTGVRVLHRSPTSMTFVTLAGHMEAGWITFSARDDAGTTVVQVESTARTGDPVFELGFKLFGHGEQEAFWRHTLTAFADYSGVAPRIQVIRTRVDASRNWDGARNLAANAAIRTSAAAFLRLLRRKQR